MHKYQIPVVKSPCPADGHTRREYVKELLGKLNRENPGVKDRIFTAIQKGNMEGWTVTLAVIKEENYHDEQNKNNILKLRKVLDTLPPFCRDFFRGIEPYTSTRTRLAYAYDIRLFFEFLHETNSFCKKREITELPLSVLDMVQRTDIEEYLDYMSLYQKDGKDITNEERGKQENLPLFGVSIITIFRVNALKKYRGTGSSAETPRKRNHPVRTQRSGDSAGPGGGRHQTDQKRTGIS